MHEPLPASQQESTHSKATQEARSSVKAAMTDTSERARAAAELDGVPAYESREIAERLELLSIFGDAAMEPILAPELSACGEQAAGTPSAPPKKAA